jgi:hypothetical protein
MTTEERFNRIEDQLATITGALGRITTTLAQVVNSQAKFDTVLSLLAEAQIKQQEQMAALERQWQAYLVDDNRIIAMIAGCSAGNEIGRAA